VAALLVEALHYKPDSRGSIPDGVIGNFIDSASNSNEYQEYFLEGKGERCAGLTTLPPPCAYCHEIWEP
jgi:hypothetical protein